MSIIKVENLTFSYPSSFDNVFDNVNFQIDTDWKLGFVGRNGKGKTTFLKILQGKLEYVGKIISSVRFDYFPYAVRDTSRLTSEVLSEVCPAAEEWRLMRELTYLDVNCDTLYRPFDTLSGGERSKVLLAALFLNDDRFLLIDEPTNHLDMRARLLLSEYLKSKKSFILVSHDRSFLDGCVDHILSLNRASIEVQSGKFTSFMTNFERRQEFERRQNDRLQADIERLKETARRTADWADRVEASKKGAADKGYVGHKSAKMMKRAKVVEGRRQKDIEQKESLLRNDEKEERLKMKPLVYRAERLVSFSEVVPIYDGKGVCPPASFEIKRGERVAIEGKNGSGKSSLLKLLCGGATEHTGKIDIGSGLVVSYVPQDTSHLSGTLSDYATERGIDETLFKTVLRKMGLSREQFEKDMSEFSDGQKKKTLLAASLCVKAHLYVWDEPLNFIDVFSRIQIENLLAEFQPSMLFVEHDKTFVDKIATKTLDL